MIGIGFGDAVRVDAGIARHEVLQIEYISLAVDHLATLRDWHVDA
jgi:hypothetical protein